MLAAAVPPPLGIIMEDPSAGMLTAVASVCDRRDPLRPRTVTEAVTYDAHLTADLLGREQSRQEARWRAELADRCPYGANISE